jgi:hypothetical protein
MMMSIALILCGVFLALAAMLAKSRYLSFTAQRPADYAISGPAFDIREQLNGPIICEGVIFGPTGRVSSRFEADVNASWVGNVGTMKESFRYDSGTVQERVWTMTVGKDGAIRAEAPDVIGVGSGQQEGSAMMLNYRIKLGNADGGHVLDATDWMYLTPSGSIMNRSQFRKFGIKVAELVATMRPAVVS